MVAQIDSSDYKGPERRKHIRYTCHVDIETVILYTPDTKTRYGIPTHLTTSTQQRAKILDISLGGMKVEMKEIMKEGTLVDIHIQTPFNTLIEGRAKVIWVRSSGQEPKTYLAGLEFQKFGWRQRWRIRRFVKWLSKIE